MFIDEKTRLLLHCEDFLDSSYYKIDGNQTDCDIVDGKFNKAIDFNNSGVLKYVLPDTRKCKNMTVDFWVYLKQYASYPTVFSTNALNGARGLYCHFVSNKIVMNLTNYKGITATENFPLNTWTHVALTLDSNNNANLFVNGQKKVSGVLDEDVDYTEILLGGLLHQGSVDGATYCGCLVDEFRVSDTVMYGQNFTPLTEQYKATNIEVLSSSLKTLRFKVNGPHDKIELIFNGKTVGEYSYTTNTIEYNVTPSDICIGDNIVSIKVFIGSVVHTENISIPNNIDVLESGASMTELMERFSMLGNTCETLRITLGGNLQSVGVDATSTDSIQALVQKVLTVSLDGITIQPGDEYVAFSKGRFRPSSNNTWQTAADFTITKKGGYRTISTMHSRGETTKTRIMHMRDGNVLLQKEAETSSSMSLDLIVDIENTRVGDVIIFMTYVAGSYADGSSSTVSFTF